MPNLLLEYDQWRRQQSLIQKRQQTFHFQWTVFLARVTGFGGGKGGRIGDLVVGTSDFICTMAADSLIVCFTNLGFLGG